MTSKLLEEINAANNQVLQAEAMQDAANAETGADLKAKDGSQGPSQPTPPAESGKPTATKAPA